jgi:hypothetical protein
MLKLQFFCLTTLSLDNPGNRSHIPEEQNAQESVILGCAVG